MPARITPLTLPFLAATLLLPLAGCDQVQSLLGSDEAKAESKDDDGKKSDDDESDDEKKADDEKKSDGEVVAKADTKPAEAEAAAAPPTEAAAEPEAKEADAEEDEEAEAEDAGAEDAGAEEAEAEAAPTEAAAAAGEQPCIVGHWEATDYLAQINQALREDPTLKKMKYKSNSGTIGYVVEPLVDGKGIVKAKASALKYKYAGKVQGLKVNLGVTMDGEIEAEYELAEPSRIIVAKPTKNNMKVSGSLSVKGLGKTKKASKVKHKFDGDFVYECTDDQLKVWTVGRGKRPLEFKRLEE